MQDQARIPWIIRLAFDLDNTAQPWSGTSPHPQEQKLEVNLYVGNLDFDVANDGDKAIKELDGDQFAGRILRVSEARPRAERRGNRSPFDRGGYRRRSA